MKYVACRTRPDKKKEYVQHGSDVPNIAWTLNFLKAAQWDTPAPIEQYKKDNKLPPEVSACQLPPYDGLTCPFCAQVTVKLDGTSRVIPETEFDVECRSCGRRWREVFKFYTVIVV